MFICADFVKVVFKWTEAEAKAADSVGSTYIRLDKHAAVAYTSTEHDKQFIKAERDKARGIHRSRDRDRVSDRDSIKSPSKRDSKADDKEDDYSKGDAKAAAGPKDRERTEGGASADSVEKQEAAATDENRADKEEVADKAAKEDGSAKPSDEGEKADESMKEEPVGLSPDPMEGPIVNGVKWVAKAVLLCGLDSKQGASIIAGPQHSGGAHMAPLLKFVTLRNALRPSELSPLGGAWDPEQDGGDPTSDPSCLVQTLVRHIKHQVGLDVSNVAPEDWLHFADIHFSRPGPEGVDSIAAVHAAVAAGVLGKQPAQGPAPAAEQSPGLEGGLKGLAKLQQHDPAGHRYLQVNSFFIIDISSLMPAPPPVIKAEIANKAVKTEAASQDGKAAADSTKANPEDTGAKSNADRSKEGSATMDTDGDKAADKAGGTKDDAAAANGITEDAAKQPRGGDSAAAAAEGGSASKADKDSQEDNKGDDDTAMTDVAEGYQRDGKPAPIKMEDKFNEDGKDQARQDKGREPSTPRALPTPRSPKPPSQPKWAITLEACRQGNLLMEPHPISLAGLLDYEESDDSEPLMELAIFAEGFHEMVMKGYGKVIYNAVLENRPDAWKREVADEAARIKRREERVKKEEEDRQRHAEERRKREEERKTGQGEEGGEKRKREDKVCYCGCLTACCGPDTYWHRVLCSCCHGLDRSTVVAHCLAQQAATDIVQQLN
eukprot:GHRR01010209.1.p1 GENE.GHRR01010209.1~~GHRR01010209.1.p1  ORF type:complete len:718 (+),score=276.21 GHRR01010209.1:881-3034(+)